MNVKEYLELVAYVDNGEYHSKFDKSRIDNIEYLAEHEITGQLSCGRGYSPKEKKWYPKVSHGLRQEV